MGTPFLLCLSVDRRLPCMPATAPVYERQITIGTVKLVDYANTKRAVVTCDCRANWNLLSHGGPSFVFRSWAS